MPGTASWVDLNVDAPAWSGRSDFQVPSVVESGPVDYISGQGVITGVLAMCRNIKTLFNFEPPATEDEVRASALHFVRKLSGFNKPSHANEAAFDLAVEEVSAVALKLLSSLHTHAPARDRAVEAEKAKERARERFA
jgi:hypothetical protein